jgi:hypothetical protein
MFWWAAGNWARLLRWIEEKERRGFIKIKDKRGFNKII